MSQQYSLRWNNHQPNFISMFTTLLNNQTLVDVTLAAEGKHLQAHKMVLSACSTYFHSLFAALNSVQHPIVILKDVSFADLRTMVDFMYYGEVNVTEEQLPQVLETAKMLKIKGLTEMPEPTMTRAQASQGQEYIPNNEASDPQRMPTPASSPSSKRRRRRKSSAGSIVNLVSEENPEENQSVELVRDGITLSSVPQRRHDNAQQTMDNSQHMNINAMVHDNQANMSQGGQWSMMEHAYPRYGGGGGGAGGGTACAAPQQELYAHEELAQFAPLACAEPQPAPDAAPPAPPKRRRTSNPQSEENFQRALEAVRFGGIGFCKAARMFGVNNRTLWLEYKKKGYPNNRPSIKSRIKREHATPPPEHKDEPPPPEHQVLLCPPHPVSLGFVERPLDFPLQPAPHPSPLNILGVNFNTMQ